MLRIFVALALLGANLLVGASRADRYALILEDPPLVRQKLAAGVANRAASAPEDAVQRIRAAQAGIETAVRERGAVVTGATQRLLNAVYVHATKKQAEQFRALSGVRRVVRMAPVKRSMNRALDQIRATGAWSQINGGFSQAGAGVRIGVLDTGIDHEHPTFQDSSLTPPPGYPRGETAYTNSKIIVARSYVDRLVLAEEPDISRPDDLSPRDRVGHGTAVAMAAAGAQVTGPAATVSGVAPKAFLGNYKIFGSPGVNDFTFTDVIILALEDALVDGMDIAVLPLGSPAEWAPSDRGAICNLPGNDPCDPRAEAVNNAVAEGMTVVVPAGNDGDLRDLGSRFPALSTVHTPGTAPLAITVGATTNSHVFFNTVRTTGSGVPPNLQAIPALLGDGPTPAAPLTAPLRDAADTEPNALACSPLGAGTMTGAIALVDRGECSFATKIINAQKGGALAVILIRTDSDVPFPMTGLIDTGIPAAMIGNTDGQNLRQFLNSNPDRPVTLDPNLMEMDAPADDIAYFSSRGPSIEFGDIKPELVAVGTDLYMATQNHDPNGDMWSPDKFTAAQGTSFAVPLVAGAAALVKQLNPGFNTADIKSAVVNTADARAVLADFDENGTQIPVSITAAGAGRLNTEQAARTTVTVSPAVVSLGVVANELPAQTLELRNHGAAPVNLTLSESDNFLSLSATGVPLAPGASQTITVSVTDFPPPGRFEGDITITGGPVPLRVPFLYMWTDDIPFDIIPLGGAEFSGNVNELVDASDFALTAKIVDRYGVPIAGVPVLFRPSGLIEEATEATDELGIVAATAVLGPNPGEQEFSVEIDGQPDTRVFFQGRAKLRPVINEGGVIDAASGRVGQGVAPGSYVSIFGTSLSEAFRVVSTPYLPLSLAGVSVSFDDPQQVRSLPGHLHFVSENQINVQVPWEYMGRNTVWLKVSTGSLTESVLYTLPLNDYLPAFFEKTDIGGSGRTVIAARDAQTGEEISSTRPAPPGSYVALFANGLGPVTNTPPSGEPTPANPLPETTQLPVITIGGQNATVQFSGLAPFFVGLYQVNVLIPGNLTPGLYEVTMTIGGVQSKTAQLYIGP